MQKQLAVVDLAEGGGSFERGGVDLRELPGAGLCQAHEGIHAAGSREGLNGGPGDLHEVPKRRDSVLPGAHSLIPKVWAMSTFVG